MEESNKKIAADFIEQIWNNGRLDILSDYLHPRFTDHSLPFLSVQNRLGFVRYLTKLNESISHKTIIEGIAAERNMVYVKLALKVESCSAEPDSSRNCVTLTGYRFFKIENQRITDHWEAIAFGKYP